MALRLHALFDSDVVFKNILDIAPFASIKSSLHLWVAQPSETAGCVALSSPTAAVPRMALNDPKMPTVCVLDALSFM